LLSLSFLYCFPGLLRQTLVSVESFAVAIERKDSCTRKQPILLITVKQDLGAGKQSGEKCLSACCNRLRGRKKGRLKRRPDEAKVVCFA
jgi:hypothetical protein